MDLEDLGGMAQSLSGGFSALTSSLDALRASVENLRGPTNALGNQQNDAKASAGGLATATGALKSGADVAAGAIRGLGSAVATIASGPVPNATQAMTAVGQVMGNVITGAADKAAGALEKLGPAGQAAAEALRAVGAIASATVGTLMTVAGVAVDVVQKMDLMRDRFAAFSGGAAAGKKLQASLEGLNLPFAKSQVEAWALSLEKAGVAANVVADRVKAIAAAEALGEGGGAAAEALFKRLGEGGAAADSFMKDLQKGGRRSVMLLKEMGITMADLGGQAAVAKMDAEQLQNAISKALQKKGAGPLADLALDMTTILTKAKEGFRSLFSGLDGPVKAFMKEVQALFSEFNKGGAATKGLKPIVTGVLTEVFSWLTRATKAAHELVQGFMGNKKAKGPFAEIGAAIGKVWDSVKGLFGALGKLNKGSPVGLSTGLSVLVFVVEAVADSISVMVDNATMAIAILSSLGDLAGSAGDALSGMADGAMSAASNFVAGLVDGITAGASQVIDAVKGLASGALSAFTGALGIHSPSTIMLEHGEDNIAGAAAMGVEAGTPRVARAMAKMGESEPGGGKGRAGASASDGGGGGERHYHYHGPMSDYDTFKRYVARYWEEAELQAGSAAEAS